MLSCCLGGSRILGGSKERAVAEGDQALSSGPVVLVANRAEIACRIINACQKLSLKAVAVYTEAGRSLLSRLFLCIVCILDLGPAPTLRLATSRKRNRYSSELLC